MLVGRLFPNLERVNYLLNVGRLMRLWSVKRVVNVGDVKGECESSSVFAKSMTHEASAFF